MKECFKCKILKSLSEFYTHHKMADGHLNKCKECTKFDARVHREKNLERVRQYDRDRKDLPHREQMRKDVAQRYSLEHKDRLRAMSSLGKAVLRGKVVPWPVCAIPECNEKPEAHHPDYSRPLDVVWLCRHHHRRAHHDYKLKEIPEWIYRLSHKR